MPTSPDTDMKNTIQTTSAFGCAMRGALPDPVSAHGAPKGDFMPDTMNENKHIAPKPTNYLGIRFRSKTEAVYARAFDLLGWLWEYEPEIEYWPHRPDFIIASHHPFGIRIVEVKPSRPSGAYLESLVACATKISAIPRHRVAIVYGNPWDGNPAVILRFENIGWAKIHEESDLLLEALHQAATYRFDLETKSAQ